MCIRDRCTGIGGVSAGGTCKFLLQCGFAVCHKGKCEPANETWALSKEKWAMYMERPGKNIWGRLSLEKKILLAVTLMILTLFVSNIFIYLQVNKIAGKMDTVYASNVNLSELSEALEHVQKDMGDYVSVKSSDSLESYYKSQQEYQEFLERLNDKTVDKPGKILEKNIRMMSESYLAVTQDAVQAKRGRNVEPVSYTHLPAALPGIGIPGI